jgi:hypothetical protein
MKGAYSPNAFGRVLIPSLIRQICCIIFGNKPKELKKLKEMKKDDTVRNLLESKFDRETIAVLLY